jgi:hypothetical protein
MKNKAANTNAKKQSATAPAPLRALGAAVDVVTDFFMAGFGFIDVSAESTTRKHYVIL